MTAFSEEIVETEGMDAPRTRSFKTYKPGNQYKTQIIAAENVVAPWGKVQAQLDVAAVDEEGNTVGSSRCWVDYPFNNKNMERADPAETLLKQRDAMGGILRGGNDKYNNYGKVEGKKRFDRDGNELDKVGIATAIRDGNNLVMEELKLRLDDAQRWIGPSGYAKFVQYTSRNGKVIKKFQDFGATPKDQLPLITNADEFYGE